MEQWHVTGVKDILASLNTDEAQGLSSEEAGQRLAEIGPNALTEKKKRSPFMMLLDQFRDFMIVVLIAAAVISGIIGDMSDTIAIVVIVILNAVIGFYSGIQGREGYGSP